MKVAVKNISNTITQDEMDAGRLQSTFDISVEEGSKITLPEAFSVSVREDLVRDAVASSRANRRQAYGSSHMTALTDVSARTVCLSAVSSA